MLYLNSYKYIPSIDHDVIIPQTKILNFYSISSCMNALHIFFLALTVREKLVNAWIAIKNVNFFDSNTMNPIKIRQEIQMTRFFFFIFILASTILIFYVSFTKKMITHTLQNPTRKGYELLETRFGDRLYCPCRRTEIQFNEVVQMTIKYHQICSSGFVSPLFIGQFYGYDTIETYKYDFMTMAGTFFTHLGLFCLVLPKMLDEGFSSRLSDKLFVQKLMSPKEFNTRISTLFLSLERADGVTIQGGTSEAVDFLTNIHALSISFISFNLHMDSNGHVHINPNNISNCSCVTQSKMCSMEAAFYQYDSANKSVEQLYQVPGIRIGCSPFQSTIQSTLECWYSSECHEKVRY